MTNMFATAISTRKRVYSDVAGAVADLEALIGMPVVEWSGPDDGSDAFQLRLENDLEITGSLLEDRISIHAAVVSEASRGSSRSILTVEDRRISKDAMPDDLPGFATPEAAIASCRQIAREAVLAAEAAIAQIKAPDGKKERLAGAMRVGAAVAVAHVSPQTSGVVIEVTMPSRWTAASVRMVGQDGPVQCHEEQTRLLTGMLRPSVRVDCFGNPPVVTTEPDVLDFDVRDLPNPMEAARILRERLSEGSVGIPAGERK